MKEDQLPSLPPVSFGVGELESIANKVAESGLMPGIDTPQAAFTLMLLCQSEGLHPAQALRRFHIIEGRPSMRADAMQAEFQRQGGRIRWKRSDAQVCEAEFSHPVTQPEPFLVTVTLKELVDSGVATRWNEKQRTYVLKEVYRKFPAQMLRARAISQGVRMTLPGVVAGIYTPEEVTDFEPMPRFDRDTAPSAESLPAPVPTKPDVLSWDQLAEATVASIEEVYASVLGDRTLTKDQEKQLAVNPHRLAISVAKDAIEAGHLEQPAQLTSAWARKELGWLIGKEPEWVQGVAEEKAAKLIGIAKQIADAPPPSGELDGPRQQSFMPPAGKGDAYEEPSEAPEPVTASSN